MKIKKWKSRVAMALCVAMTGILVGCGATGEEESSVDMSEAGGKNTIVVLNYGEYIDTSVLKQFQKETGIKVLYEEATTPEEMYSKYKASTIPYDLICSSDYMVERLIEEGETEEISARCSTSIISETCIGRCQNPMTRNSSTVSRIFGEQ